MFDLTDSNDPIDQHLIDLFNAARADATTEELAAEGNIVLAMQQAMTPVPSNVITFRSNSMRQRFATSKAATKAAIISGVVLFSATAAAAGGVLPDSAQSAVSRAVSHIGIDISNPEKSADDNSALASDDTATDNSVDDNSTDNSFDDSGDDSASRVSKVNHDLCEDLGTTSSTDDSTTSSTDDSATPSQSLDDAAAAAGMTVTEFCASVDDDSSNGVGDDSGDDVGDDKGGLIGGHGSDDAVTSSSIDDSSDDDSDDSTQSTVAQVTIPGQNIAPSTSVADDSGSNSGKNSGKNKGGTSTDSRG
ncbi:MAG: hypothetical protein F2659_01120 [Actinobacteria bacterium]|uniref:Unannotated protein n=1 Tax=freshwater metagenome TaxID=449393 RepID=A0A6J6N583_9ZZZZ|nr:hypothetical protein [Actinomycetota bacterium]